MTRPGASTSTICSGAKTSSKAARKWPRDLTTSTLSAGDVDAEALQHARLVALLTDRDDDHVDALVALRWQPQARAEPEVHRAPGDRAATADDDPVCQRHNPGRRLERLAQRMRLGAVEAGGEFRAFAQRMRLCRQLGIVEHRQRGSGDPGLVKGPQDMGGVAAGTAAGIIGDVGEQQRRQGRVPACPDRHGGRLHQRRQLGHEAVPLPPQQPGELFRCPVRRRLPAAVAAVAGGDDHRHAVLG